MNNTGIKFPYILRTLLFLDQFGVYIIIQNVVSQNVYATTTGRPSEFSD